MACKFYNGNYDRGYCEVKACNMIPERACLDDPWHELCSWYNLKACKYYEYTFSMGWCKAGSTSKKIDYSTEEKYCTQGSRCRECEKYH